MQFHNQDVFLIESLQPSWLQIPRWRLIYTLASRLISMLIVGLVFGLVIGMLGLPPPYRYYLEDGPIYELTKWLVFYGIVGSLYFGILIGVVDILRNEWLNEWQARNKLPQLIWTAINVIFIGVIAGAISGENAGWIFDLIIGVIIGLVFGLRGSRQNLLNDIMPIESLSWDWGRAVRGGLVGGLIGGLIGWASNTILIKYYTRPDGSFPHPSVPLFNLDQIGWQIGIFIGIVFSGLTPKIIETKTTTNQGIHLSAKISVRSGLVIGFMVSVIIGQIGKGPVSDYFGLGLISYFQWGLGMALGTVGVYWFGGLDVVQHYTLRLILSIQGHISRNYAHFLDYAVDRIFLQKVGGGYRFIHRMLLEHFAEMGTTTKKE